MTRIVSLRHFLTFGLGTIFDLGDITRRMRRLDELIDTASRNRDDAQRQLGNAKAQLSDHQGSIQRFNALQGQLNELGPQLEGARQALERDRQHMAEVVNTAFDVSVFLGGIAAQTAPWDAIHSASGFVTAITRLQGLVEANASLTSIFVTDAALLDISLRLIASIDAGAMVSGLC